MLGRTTPFCFSSSAETKRIILQLIFIDYNEGHGNITISVRDRVLL